MSTARKALYAVVGASTKALDEAKSFPKRAGALPGLVTSTAHAAAGKAAQLPRLINDTTKVVRDLPKQARSLPKHAETLQKQARELPKVAFGVAGKVRDLAGEALKDATKRFNAYAKAGEKVLSRNGSNGSSNGKSVASKAASKARKPKVAHAETSKTVAEPATTSPSAE